LLYQFSSCQSLNIVNNKINNQQKLSFMKKNVYLLCLSFSLMLCFAGYGQSFDMVLRIDNIEGESTLVGHKGEITVFSYSDGISTCLPNSGNKNLCKAVAGPLNFMSQFDKSTIPLKIASASGKVIPSADMTLIRLDGSGKPLEFLKIHLENLTVVSVQESGSSGGDSRPTVSVSLSYSRIAWQYTQQSSTGGAGDQVTDGWDFVLAKPFVYTF
jgi:type VI secretion system Hcp family effector